MNATLTKRPVLHLPQSRPEQIAEIIAGVGILATVYLLLDHWLAAPPFPDAADEATPWHAQLTLLIVPAISFAIYAGMTILNRFPHIFNYPFALTEENVERQYRCARLLMSVVKAEVVLLFCYIEWQMMESALGNPARLHPGLLVALVMAGTLGTIAAYFYKASKLS